MNASREHEFIGYEYKEIMVRRQCASIYVDGYQHFGWIPDANHKAHEEKRYISIGLKRDRKLVNHMELTRLQRNFEACMHEIEMLERSQICVPRIKGVVAATIGTVFMAGATFAVTHEPPLILLCAILSVPGFLGWIATPFVYRWANRVKAQQIKPLIQEKHAQIYQLCEKGNRLLYI